MIEHSDMEYSHLMHFSMEHSDRGDLPILRFLIFSTRFGRILPAKSR